jgi:hypothetical protein
LQYFINTIFALFVLLIDNFALGIGLLLFFCLFFSDFCLNLISETVVKLIAERNVLHDFRLDRVFGGITEWNSSLGFWSRKTRNSAD